MRYQDRTDDDVLVSRYRVPVMVEVPQAEEGQRVFDVLAELRLQPLASGRQTGFVAFIDAGGPGEAAQIAKGLAEQVRSRLPEGSRTRIGQPG